MWLLSEGTQSPVFELQMTVSPMEEQVPGKKEKGRIWSTNKKFHQCKGRRLCKGTSNDNPESILAFAHVCNVVNEICFSSVKS